MQLRPARPDDAMAVARVHVRSWQAGYRGLLPDAFLETMRPEERAARYTFGDPDPAQPKTILAVDANKILGFATVSPARDNDEVRVGELCALYVDPDHWRRGIGAALMAAADARLRDMGFDAAMLWVLKHNARAERFYRKNGWNADGAERMASAWGLMLDEVRYRRGFGTPHP